MYLYLGVGAAVLAVLGYIKFLKIKNNGLKANQLTSDAKVKDAALSQQQKDNQAAIDALDKKQDAVDSDNAPANADYWNGKLKK
jgi:hypothetical protein